MQRALHGLAVSPLNAAIELRTRVAGRGHARRRPVGPAVRGPGAGPARAGWTAARPAIAPCCSSAGETSRSRLRVLEAGDHVTVNGTLEPLSGFDARYRWRHAVARVQVTELVDFGSPRSPLGRLANAARAAVLRGGDRAAGDRTGAARRASCSATPARSRTTSSTTSATPASATCSRSAARTSRSSSRSPGRCCAGSGSAAGSCCGLGGARAVRHDDPLGAVGAPRRPRWPASRWPPRSSGAPSPASRLLTFAAFGLLVADPFLVHSVGFLLSCGAAAGILLLGADVQRPDPRSPRRRRGTRRHRRGADRGAARHPPGVRHDAARRAPGQPARGSGRRSAHRLGTGRGRRRWAARPRRRPLLQLPTYALLRWVETVARTAASEPLAIDGRALCGLLALSGAAAALLGLLRLREKRAWLAPAGVRCAPRRAFGVSHSLRGGELWNSACWARWASTTPKVARSTPADPCSEPFWRCSSCSSIAWSRSRRSSTGCGATTRHRRP